MRAEPYCSKCDLVDKGMKEKGYAEFFSQFTLIPVDVATEEGRDMARACGIRTVPAFICDTKDVVKVYVGSDVASVKSWFEEVQKSV